MALAFALAAACGGGSSQEGAAPVATAVPSDVSTPNASTTPRLDPTPLVTPSAAASPLSTAEPAPLETPTPKSITEPVPEPSAPPLPTPAATAVPAVVLLRDPIWEVEWEGVPNWEYVAVSAGWDFACGLRIGGKVECWGDDSYGQLDAPSGEFVAVSSGGGALVRDTGRRDR